MSQFVAVAPRRVSKSQASVRLGIPVKAVDRLIERGELKAVAIPGLRTTVLESSVNELIARMNESERRAG